MRGSEVRGGVDVRVKVRVNVRVEVRVVLGFSCVNEVSRAR